MPTDHGRLVKLTQDLVQKREELLGGEEVQVPLMEPIHFEKVLRAREAAPLRLGRLMSL